MAKGLSSIALTWNTRMMTVFDEQKDRQKNKNLKNVQVMWKENAGYSHSNREKTLCDVRLNQRKADTPHLEPKGRT
ncbi:hypothetical protein [Heliomicrobium modesticaldum]|uniref:hypothetical protein n=1 Tax=Heliomicrobium modesticaldum TaxID=35701 RepID=UPI0011D11D7A|nr:hypothetical protein [Heliomicrobium modesticaldum]